MSAPARGAGGGARRLVTRAEPTPQQAARTRARYAIDPSAPNPVVQADAMGSTVLAHLITGPVLFGALGWLVDRWLGVTGFVAAGLIIGMTLSLYTIWLRYGTSEAPAKNPQAGSAQVAAPHNEENP